MDRLSYSIRMFVLYCIFKKVVFLNPLGSFGSHVFLIFKLRRQSEIVLLGELQLDRAVGGVWALFGMRLDRPRATGMSETLLLSVCVSAWMCVCGVLSCRLRCERTRATAGSVNEDEQTHTHTHATSTNTNAVLPPGRCSRGCHRMCAWSPLPPCSLYTCRSRRS